ncbi:MAG TPA: class I SAM-dependent methyltransferase [Firmicutes bacterium]|jgi:O-methyltransferase involved in polyketide biosynthesis|nr:class I SAM-dependent methyltransferase [Bacillota bacterium]
MSSSQEVSMSENREINLGAVQETLLLPLWGRALETQKNHPLLVDKVAVSIIRDLDYDFSQMAKNVNPLSCLSWVARSIYFDQEIKCFLDQYPEGTVVNIGCGLDTTFDRVDNGKVHWYDLDLPDVMDLRKRYIRETARREFIAASVMDAGWYSKIKDKQHVLLLIAGVIYYFEEKDVQKLFAALAREFGKVQVLLDYSSKTGVKIPNKKVIESGGMSEKANLVWGIDHLEDLEKWETPIKILHNMPMFHRHKNNYPWRKRLGMMISDNLKIMSLAHMEITGV